MGTIFAATYATLSMGYPETELYAILLESLTIFNKIGKDF